MEPRVHITIRIRSPAPSQQRRLEVMRIGVAEKSGKCFLLNVDSDAGRLQFRLNELCFLRIEWRTTWNEQRKGDATRACLSEFGLGIVDVIAIGRNTTTIRPTAR